MSTEAGHFNMGVDISVVIPCREKLPLLREQLDSLRVQTWSEPWEVVLANNDPRADLSVLLKRYQDAPFTLRIVDATHRRGAAFARNTGAAAARGRFLLFCDADDRVGDHWLPCLAAALQEHAFVACRRDPYRLNLPWQLDARPWVRETQVKGLMRTHGYLPWASASTLAIRRELHLAVGGFDPTFLAFEDLDYCWRVQEVGAALTFVPEALVHYRVKRGNSAIFRQASTYSENMVLLYKRYRHAGLRPAPFQWAAFLKGNGWFGLLRRLPNQWAQERSRAEWLWHAGWRWGTLRGSIRHGYPMLH